MTRKAKTRQRALDAAKELIESLDLSEDEQHLVLGIALDRYESVCLSLERIGLSENCLSAVFAAALEYSETLRNPESNSLED